MATWSLHWMTEHTEACGDYKTQCFAILLTKQLSFKCSDICEKQPVVFLPKEKPLSLTVSPTHTPEGALG